jgi:outer membrane protein assembly factor BamB
MKTIIYTIIFLVVCGLSALNASEPWTSIELKTATLSGYVKASNPVFSPDGNTIYIPTSTPNGHLFAVDRATGAINWVFQISSITYGGGAVVGSDGTIYQGARDKKVYAINPDGTQKWVFTGLGNFDVFPALSADGVLYCIANGSVLHALNASNGAEIWNRTLTGTTGGALAIDNGGNVYAGTNSKIVKYNSSGVLQWETTALNVTEIGSFAINGTTLYAALKAGAGLAAVNMTNGSILWTYASSSDAYFPIVGPDGTIYFNEKDTDRKVYAINPDGTLKWSSAIEGNMNYGGLVLSDAGKLYGGTQSRVGANYQIFEVDAITGVKSVLLETDQQISASATIGPDNKLYIGSIRASSADNFGKLFALAINAGIETGSWSMRGRNIQGVNRIDNTTTTNLGKAETKILVYTNDKQLIISNIDNEQEAFIFSINGMLVKSLNLNQGQNKLSLDKGVYILKLKSGATHKVVI